MSSRVNNAGYSQQARIGSCWDAVSREMTRRTRSTDRRLARRLTPELAWVENRRLLSTFDVTSWAFDDGSTGTLRWAVEEADLDTSASKIVFELGPAPATISLTLGQLELSNTIEPVAIYDGPGQGPVTISGNDVSRVFQVTDGVTASFSGLMISGAVSTGPGGGLYNQGTVALTDCIIGGNSAWRGGGGLYNLGTATLVDCTISGNDASGSGGGLANNGGMTLTDCTISGNSTVNSGAGLFNYGTAAIEACTISDNSANNSGGGLYDMSGTANLQACTISGNSAHEGGGLGNYGDSHLTACTVAENSAAEGGGLFNGGNTVSLIDTIVDGNGSGGSASDIGGSLASNVTGSYDLIGTGGSGALSAANHNLIDEANPLLSPLGDYGGSTQTMALLLGSPAIGAGTAIGGITTDQRGFPFDSPTPDIGAFQTNSLVVNTTGDGTGSPFGDMSLRQAVNLADALGGTESITFSGTAFATAQTIELAAGQLELSGPGLSASIRGPRPGLTINAGGASRVFQIDSGVTATLSGLTITDGLVAGYGSGGGVLNSGTVTLDECTITGSSAFGGGAVGNSGTAMLDDCIITGNSAY